MTGAIECRYYRRDFTADEMALLRALIAVEPQPNRAALSREFCRCIGWLQARRWPQGHDGPRHHARHAPRRRDRAAAAEGAAQPAPPHCLRTGHRAAPEMRPVVRETREGRLWNEFVARYHYLGYKTLVGAQMRYAVHDRNGWPVAMLGFSTAAWKLAPRDRFIGWTPELREKNLPLVVDNPRFLILPWIEIPNLGSHILALVRRRLPEDWAERYNTAPVLIETFVETPRYTGAVYRASGWLRVGTPRARTLRSGQALRQAPQGRLAQAPQKGLAAHPQSERLPQGCARLGNKTVPMWYLNKTGFRATKDNPR